MHSVLAEKGAGNSSAHLAEVTSLQQQALDVRTAPIWYVPRLRPQLFVTQRSRMIERFLLLLLNLTCHPSSLCLSSFLPSLPLFLPDSLCKHRSIEETMTYVRHVAPQKHIADLVDHQNPCNPNSLLLTTDTLELWSRMTVDTTDALGSGSRMLNPLTHKNIPSKCACSVGRCKADLSSKPETRYRCARRWKTWKSTVLIFYFV